jgi:hypothetical protein
MSGSLASTQRDPPLSQNARSGHRPMDRFCPGRELRYPIALRTIRFDDPKKQFDVAVVRVVGHALA